MICSRVPFDSKGLGILLLRRESLSLVGVSQLWWKVLKNIRLI